MRWQLPSCGLLNLLNPHLRVGLSCILRLKNWISSGRNTHARRASVGVPSLPWVPPPDGPFLPPGCRSIPSSSETPLPSHKNKYFGSRAWFRLPTGCHRLLLSQRRRRRRSQGLFLLPGSLTGLLPGRFPHPIFSFPACGSWEEGLPVSIAMRLALISISFLGELITKGVTK